MTVSIRKLKQEKASGLDNVLAEMFEISWSSTMTLLNALTKSLKVVPTQIRGPEL